MAWSRIASGAAAALAALPLEMLQMRFETGLAPRCHPPREVALACTNGVAYAVQTRAREAFPPPWGALVAAVALTPMSVALTGARVRARYAVRPSPRAWRHFAALLFLHELVLYTLLGRAGPVVACVAAYAPKWLAMRRVVVAGDATAPRAAGAGALAAAANTARASFGLALSDALASWA